MQPPSVGKTEALWLFHQSGNRKCTTKSPIDSHVRISRALGHVLALGTDDKMKEEKMRRKKRSVTDRELGRSDQSPSE